MILAAAVAAAVAAAQPAAAAAGPSLLDVSRAIESGRLDQAKLMIANAVAAGAKGFEIERLVADLAYASGRHDEALAGYERLLSASPHNALIAERAGLAALKLGQIDRAQPLIARATSTPAASWRAWNARGVLADLQGDWATADSAYAQAGELAPESAEIANNRGWSQLVRGNWAGAIVHFERALAIKPDLPRLPNNLELARAALASDLPARRPGEDGREWAERLNDAGVAAQLMGNQTKAVAAFTRAIEASDSWYARAANNLATLTKSK